jgi:hypothetical protein
MASVSLKKRKEEEKTRLRFWEWGINTPSLPLCLPR